MKDKLSKKAMTVLALFTIMGLGIAIHTIVFAVQAFNFPVLIIQLLEMSGLVWAYYYVFGEETKSKPFFLCMFINLALVLLLVYSLFPNTHLTESIRRVTATISILGLAGIVFILSSWKNYKVCIPVAYGVSAGFLVLAVIDTATAGNTYMMLSDIWVRPVLAALITGCYIARMHQKFGRK